MPESRRRKPKPGRQNARQHLARHDGEVIRVRACCALVITLGVGRIGVAHDDHCPAIRPASPRFITARTEANAAVAKALGNRGIPTLAVMVR